MYKTCRPCKAFWAMQTPRYPLEDAVGRQHGACCSNRTTQQHVFPAQVPQYLLEDAIERQHGACCSIICTQPRRIAAISVAERVANERGDTPPGTPGEGLLL